MDRIWAPWRSKYLTTINTKQKGCLFCRIGKQQDDYADHVFLRRKYCYAVLNLYPYNNGHTLIVPYRHVDDVSKMRGPERLEFFELLNCVKSLLDEVLKPEGYNVGINIGRAAGAGIPRHVHMHVVPRWNGDVNFIPVTANTKVISQSLDELQAALKKADKKRKKS